MLGPCYMSWISKVGHTIEAVSFGECVMLVQTLAYHVSLQEAWMG